MAKKKKLKRVRGGASVPCPRCDSPTHVVITRRVEGKVTRKRECTHCGHKFSTVEKIT